MRAPFICRPCLARLRQTVSYTPPQRLSRATSHAQAVQADDQNPDFESRWPSQVRQSETDPARDVQDSDALPRIRHFRKYHGRWDHVGESSRRGPLLRLKTRILNTQGNLALLWREIGRVYGLPLKDSQEATRQLKQMFWHRPRQETAAALDEFEVWKVEYAKLLKRFHGFESAPTTFRSMADWAVFPEGEAPSTSAMKASWEALDQTQRAKLWSRMVLSMLESNPNLLPAFIEATYDSSLDQPYIIEDVVRLLLLRAGSIRSGHDDLLRLVCHVLDESPPSSIRIGQDVIGVLVSRSSPENALLLFDLLKEESESLSQNTYLQFASVFAKNSSYKLHAAQILCNLAKSQNFDLNRPAASSICTSLLHLADGQEPPQGQAAPDELFRMLLDHGLQPNLLNITALIKNFCVRGYLDTAWTVFDLLRQYGLEADEHVYATLLDASKKKQDLDSVRRVFMDTQSDGMWNVHTVNGFLDTIYIDNEMHSDTRRRQRKGNNAFRIMLQVYAKFFHLEPLQKLCAFPLENYLAWQGPAPANGTQIVELAFALMPQPESRLKDPDTVTLTLMLSAAIRGAPIFYSKSGSQHMVRQMNHFNRLLSEGDSTAVGIIERHGSLVYDIIIRGLLQFGNRLKACVRMVKTMLQAADQEKRMYGCNSRHPQPSVNTWTMLVNGFKNHRQPGIAASIVKMMITEGGIKPNMVTWNALIAAFARVDHARGAVKAMRYMEQSGLRPDKYTIKALSYMSKHARRQALTLMEQSKQMPLAQDELGVILTAPTPSDAKYPDPVVQQKEEDQAPPLSPDEVMKEMDRLAERGDSLLLHDIRTYKEEDFPQPLFTGTGAFGASQPRNSDPLRQLLEYKADVEAFIAHVRGPKQVPQSLIGSTAPIAKPIGMPLESRLWTRKLRRVWREAYEAREKLHDLQHDERPVGLRLMEEETQQRNYLRAKNFPDKPIGEAPTIGTEIPMGFVAAQGEAPARIDSDRHINPSLRKEISKARQKQAKSKRFDGYDTYSTPSEE